MGRTFLFMAAALSPAALWAQGPDAFNADRTGNWETIAAGGGRFFFALIAGILLAYAFQWIMTCISLATGATAAHAQRGGRPLQGRSGEKGERSGRRGSARRSEGRARQRAVHDGIRDVRPGGARQGAPHAPPPSTTHPTAPRADELRFGVD